MAICTICEGKAGLNRFKIIDGWICSKCFKKCGFNLSTPIMQFDSLRIKALLASKEQTLKELETFRATKAIGAFIEFDENSKKIKLIDSLPGQKADYKIYQYKDILDCDLVEDSISKTNGGLAQAVVGGVLAGGIGAIIGSSVGDKVTSKAIVDNLSISVTVNDLSSPVAYIRLISSKVKTNSIVYQNALRFANDILSAFTIILNENRKEEKAAELAPQIDVVSEITKFKKLFDDGIISQEEFDAKKKQLLNI